MHTIASFSNRQLHSDLNLARRAGSRVVRVDIGWSSFQARRGRFSRWYMRKVDAFMHAATARGLGVVAVVQSTPCWASSAPASLKQGCRGDWWNREVPWYPPNDDSRYASFVRFFTHRYARALAAVEIWNEPDQDQQRYWKSSNPAASYAALVKAAYPAAKQGNANVPVLAGSLAGSDILFLRKLYGYGIRGYYDGISLHPYCQPEPPNARHWPGQGPRWMFSVGLRAMHAAQLRAGDSTPLWATEFGWASGRGHAEISERRQARYTREAIAIAGRMPYVRAAIVYALHNDGSDPSFWMDNFGLLHLNGTPKLAFFALAAAARGAR